MIRSMTAFARKESLAEWGLVVWELRSVNHRYLECAVRLPETLRSLEIGVRERVGKYLGRGKVECNLKLQADTRVAEHISLNLPLAERLLAIAAELGPLLGSGAGMQLGDVLRWPGVVNEAEANLDKIGVPVLDALEEALVEMLKVRESEGSRITEMILQRCDAMQDNIRDVRKRRPQVLVRLRDKLLMRLSELPVEADLGRLEQEMAIMSQRLDVEEELDRLDSHLVEIRQVLEREEPVGRRLDFLMQELNREANTLASKSADTETTRVAVELKVLIEQMREQVQNIE
jgi:uncharacterized protein (TIGR00255 family)